jgi:cytochrome c-type biogenesis protein CcmE
MNRLQKQRLYLLSIFSIGIIIAASLILFSLRQNINVFLTPKDIHAETRRNYHFRLGGLVKDHSLIRTPHSLGVQFVVTDLTKDITVRYEGILPDLFHEGKGVIAEGYLNSQGEFIASQVLAKHDENYMPKNVYMAMRSVHDKK